MLAHDGDVVLAVGLAKKSRRLLAALSGSAPWRLMYAERLGEALRKVRSGAVRVVVCERDLPDGNWRLLFDAVQELARPPRFIVVSRFADESLWAEVLNLGGYDVLAMPLRAEEVSRVVGSAMDTAPWHSAGAMDRGRQSMVPQP